MRYQNPRLQDRLAAEYVTGNLRGKARRRFEKLLFQYPEIQNRISVWAARFQAADNDLTPAIPPETVWTGILSRIEKSEPQSGSNRMLWYAGMAATLLLLIGSWFIVTAPPAGRVAVVKNKKAETVWVMRENTKSHRIKVKTLRSPQLPKNKTCVLWLVWKDGKTHAVGFLPDSVGTRDLLLPNLTRNPEAADVVVSIEDAGVSPSEPGEIVFKGPWRNL